MRLMISGGGTGGHIYPALALIKDLKRLEPQSKILYVGSKRGLEKNIVPKEHIPFKALHIQGFKRSLSPTNFKTVWLFMRSVSKSLKLIKQFKPDIVVGTGGYVSGAVVFAAHLKHIPTMIHEQNSIVGLTNKFLSHFVDKIAITFPNVRSKFPARKVIQTGNPRAQEAAHVKSNFKWSQYGLKDNVPTVLIFGGSQGALKINQSVVKAIKSFNNKSYQVVFVTGQKRYKKVMDLIKQGGVKPNKNIVIKSYINNMPQVLPKVDLIVGRAGATSLSEITAIGLPSILIPSPYVTANHQMKNAMTLVKPGAAKLLTEKDLNHETLVSDIDKLITNKKLLAKMAQHSKYLGHPEAADRIINLMETMITDHHLMN